MILCLRMAAVTIALILSSVCLAQTTQSTTQESTQTNTEATSLNITISGVDGELEQNVRAMLEILQLNEQPTPAIFRLRYMIRQAQEDIHKALEPFGYYNVEVQTDVTVEGPSTNVNFAITPGPVTRIASLQFAINGDAKDDQAFSIIEVSEYLVVGDPLRHRPYERLKTRLRNLAAERGYYNATFTENRIKVEKTKQEATISLKFDSGERYVFGEAQICCNHLSPDFLKRFLTYEQGDPFNTRELLDLQVALSGSNYFNSVEISPLWQQSTQQQVPIDVRLTPNERDRYQIGPGYGTDTGARLTLAYDRRWVNDRGHRISSYLRLSEVQNTGSFTYVIPGAKPATDFYSVTTEITDQSFEQQRSTLYQTYLRDVRHFDQWQRTWQLAWLREDFRFGDTPRTTSEFLVPTADFSYVDSTQTLANKNLTNGGYRFGIRVQGGSDAVLSDTSFASILLNAKWVYSLSDKWRVLLRGELGAIKTSNFSELAPTLRFFAGGDYSVRGYAYQQLGPRNSEDVVIGGRYLVTGSLEFDYRFRENWRVAVFSDVGNTSLHWPVDLKQTWGVGVRWLSPIGPVRFDIAQALDEPSKPWRLHITLGPDL